MLLTAVALLLAARMLGRPDYRWQLAVATGVVLGLGQLVRAFSLWTFAAVVIAFVVARAWRPLAVVVRSRRRSSPRPGTSARRSSTAIRSSTDQRSTRRSGSGGRRASTSASGCRTSSRIRSVRTSSTRRSRRRTARSGATTSASGAEAASGRASSACCRRCSRSRAGCCCSRARARSARRFAAALLPGLGLLGYLYFTVSYPTADGDVLKASYMLTTAPAWALAFGYGLDRLPSSSSHRRRCDPRRFGARRDSVPAVLSGPMRYVVTGAAGFIGSHLTEALVERGHDVVAVDSFTDYYDPALKEENASALDVSRLDLAEDDLDARRRRRCLPSRGPAGRAQLRRRLRRVRAAQPARDPPRVRACREGGRARRVRVVVVGVRRRRALSDARGRRAAPISPYGITKAGCEQLAYAYAKSFGLDAVVLRYFTFYGPRQRPDMAFARIVDALARGSSFELYGDGLQSRSFTYVARRRRRDDRRDGERSAGRRLQRRRRARGDDARRDRDARGVSGRSLDVVERPAAAGDVRRTAADVTAHRARARLARDDVDRGRFARSVGVGLG